TMRRKAINIGGEIIEIPDFPKGQLLFFALVGLVLIFLFTGLYKVDASEVGVIQRFGKYVRTTEPGLHFRIPLGIETVAKVPVRRVLKQEFGFRTTKAGVRTQFARGSFDGEKLMLTGDLSSALVEWIVQYKISDPIKYLFKVRSVDETLRDVSESVMRLVVGDHSVDEVITLSRQDIELQAKDLMQRVLNDFETGLSVENVKLQNVEPPEKVQPAFDEVNQAVQEKERIINEAQTAYNKVIPQALGQKQQVISEAEGYALDRVNRAKGDAEKFLAIWREYSKAKDVTRRRMYLETMIDILPKLENIYIVDEQQKGLVPLLQLTRKEGTK
ncbi:MAG: FtsH protease activity modulator HflK, partial [bacterium]